jgi:hypothetical protein
MELPLLDETIQEKFPEMVAMYNLIDTDKYKVKGHLLENDKLSFTVYCDKEDAVCISNRVQNHIMSLYDKEISVSYNIHKDGIDLIMN